MSELGKIDRGYFIFPAVIGLLLFGAFQLAKPAYYRYRQERLAQNLQAQISNLQQSAGEDSEKIKVVSETKKTLTEVTKNSRRLSLDVGTYEKNYLVLESLDNHYRYRQEFTALLARLFEYDPENDLNSRSVTEYKGDFMYRLSLTQYALKQITTRLKKYDDGPRLANYTKKITNQFPPIIDLIDRLVETTNENQIKTSNQLRLQYIADIHQLQTNLKPLYDQTLQDLDTTIRSFLSQIKI